MSHWNDVQITFYGSYRNIYALLVSIRKAFKQASSCAKGTTPNADILGPNCFEVLLNFHGLDAGLFSCRGTFDVPFKPLLAPKELQVAESEVTYFELYSSIENTFEFERVLHAIANNYSDIRFVYTYADTVNQEYINTDARHIFYKEEYYVRANLPNSLEAEFMNLAVYSEYSEDAGFAAGFTFNNLYTELLILASKNILDKDNHRTISSDIAAFEPSILAVDYALKSLLDPSGLGYFISANKFEPKVA